MDIAQAAIGPEGKLDVAVEGGKLILTVSHVHASGEISMVAKEDLKYFLEKLKVAIPGQIDDVIINVAEAALP